MTETQNSNLESHKKLSPVGYCTPVIIPREELHRTFGGIISFSDFCTERFDNENQRSKIADRIMSHKKFDGWCKSTTARKEMMEL